MIMLLLLLLQYLYRKIWLYSIDDIKVFANETIYFSEFVRNKIVAGTVNFDSG